MISRRLHENEPYRFSSVLRRGAVDVSGIADWDRMNREVRLNWHVNLDVTPSGIKAIDIVVDSLEADIKYDLYDEEHDASFRWHAQSFSASPNQNDDVFDEIAGLVDQPWTVRIRNAVGFSDSVTLDPKRGIYPVLVEIDYENSLVVVRFS